MTGLSAGMPAVHANDRDGNGLRGREHAGRPGTGPIRDGGRHGHHTARRRRSRPVRTHVRRLPDWHVHGPDPERHADQRSRRARRHGVERLGGRPESQSDPTMPSDGGGTGPQGRMNHRLRPPRRITATRPETVGRREPGRTKTGGRFRELSCKPYLGPILHTIGTAVFIHGTSPKGTERR